MRKSTGVLFAFVVAAAGFTIAPMTASVQANERCESAMTIEPGDTLNRIARRCGVEVSRLISENPHIGNPDIVPVGTKIEIPDRDFSGAAAARQVEAQAGDTLAAIADRHGVPLAVVISVNPEVHPEDVAVGTLIGLPEGG